MSFIIYIPYGKKSPHDLTTSTDKEVQLWQELTMFRHINRNTIYGKKVSAPYVDQAKTYYHDAKKSNWKSAGLLYYYSFLNLAKVFIVAKRTVPANYLKSTSIYHGLQSNPQNPTKIVDFEINIHPPTSNNKKNIFSLFYEKLCGQKWPFNGTVTIKVKDIAGYCDEILHELQNFYGTTRKKMILQSIIRDDGRNVWFEVIVPDTRLNEFTSYLGASVGLITNFANLSNNDKIEWHTAYERTPSSMRECSLVRINQLAYTQANATAIYNQLQTDTEALFKDYISPLPVQDFQTDNYWTFTPKASINGTDLLWHPLLSNYLFAFMLSTILRYHPHIFSIDSQNAFTAEAWCNQCPISTLRYFLMELSDQTIRIN